MEKLGEGWRGRIVLDVYEDRVVGNLLPHGECPEGIVRQEEKCSDFETTGACESLVCDLLTKLKNIESERKKVE